MIKNIIGVILIGIVLISVISSLSVGSGEPIKYEKFQEEDDTSIKTLEAREEPYYINDFGLKTGLYDIVATDENIITTINGTSLHEGEYLNDMYLSKDYSILIESGKVDVVPTQLSSDFYSAPFVIMSDTTLVGGQNIEPGTYVIPYNLKPGTEVFVSSPQKIINTGIPSYSAQMNNLGIFNLESQKDEIKFEIKENEVISIQLRNISKDGNVYIDSFSLDINPLNTE